MQTAILGNLVDKWLHHSVLTGLSGRLNFIDVVETFSFLFVCFVLGFFFLFQGGFSV